MKTFWQIVNWKLAIAILLGIAMLFAPRWLDKDIMLFERIMHLPVIDLTGEGEEEGKEATSQSHTLVVPVHPPCHCEPRCPCDLDKTPSVPTNSV